MPLILTNHPSVNHSDAGGPWEFLCTNVGPIGRCNMNILHSKYGLKQLKWNLYFKKLCEGLRLNYYLFFTVPFLEHGKTATVYR